MRVKMLRVSPYAAAVLSAWLSTVVLTASHVFAQTPFYQGKTITIVQGREPGGTGDMRARSVFSFLRKYIPGNPTVITEFMAGAGGRKAANHIFRGARPDGLTIGNVGAGLIANAVLGEPGVQYDLEKFIYLGTPNSASHYIFLTKREAGFSNLEKLRAATGIRIGAQSVGHDIYMNGRMFAWILSLKDPKFVTGYSGPEVDAALMRGEIDARANIADTIVQRTPEWIEKRLVDFHSIIEIPKGDKHPKFAHLPEMESFAKTDRERKVIALNRAFRLGGSPFILPPGTPKELADILREAMRKTYNDPEFHKEFKKLTGDDPTPLMPEALEKYVRELPRDPDTIELFKKLAGADPLPSR
jgi:tripartite-type tricarboxylate transporter receptor subunit TctC